MGRVWVLERLNAQLPATAVWFGCEASEAHAVQHGGASAYTPHMKSPAPSPTHGWLLPPQEWTLGEGQATLGEPWKSVAVPSAALTCAPHGCSLAQAGWKAGCKDLGAWVACE